MAVARKSLVVSFLLGASLITLLFAMLAFLWIQTGFSARQKPATLETKLARFALDASFPQPMKSLRNPLASTPQLLAEARDHYADHCASCHANNGSGQTMYGEGLNPPPPDLRLTLTQTKTDGELYSIIENGIRMSGMPAFGSGGDNDESTWKLVLFLRQLPSLTPEDMLKMQQANPITPSEFKEQQEEDNFLNSTPAKSQPTKGNPK